MRIETTRPLDIVAANAVSVLLLGLVWLLPESPTRVILGLPFVLFFPGYVLVAALFPERARDVERPAADAPGGVERVTEGLDSLERVALSFGLSIAVVPLLGLALNYTPLGIRLVPVLATVAAWTLVVGAVAAWRRDRLPKPARLRLVVDVEPPRWREYGAVDKTLTVLLAVAVLSAGGALAYVATTPRTGEAFTEFYVLGPGGKADGYPTSVNASEEARLIVGVVNHEHEDVDYRVVVTLTPGAFVENATGARRFEATGEPERVLALDVPLPDGGKWEENVTIAAPANPGTYRLGLDLERAPEAAAYRSLHLWVTVAAARLE